MLQSVNVSYSLPFFLYTKRQANISWTQPMFIANHKVLFKKINPNKLEACRNNDMEQQNISVCLLYL